jgi:hypothetical protein
VSLLNNSPKTKGKKADLGFELLKYGALLTMISAFLGPVCSVQVTNLGQTLHKLKAAKAVITKVGKNPLAENTGQPASLNRSGGDTSQVPSNDAESHLGAAEEAIRQKINFFRVAKKFFFFLCFLGCTLMSLSVWFLLDSLQKGREE